AAHSDNRAGRERLPSRWLLAEAGRLAGRVLHSEDLPRLRDQAWLDWVGSSAPAAGAHAAGAAELLIASLARWRAHGLALAEHPLTQGTLALGLEALRARRGGEFGRWTGHVGALPGLALGDTPLSPTRLQTWAACPFRSYLERVLGVEELLRPEETVRIEPREWGNLLHRVLERFVAEGEPPAPGAPWTPADRARLHRLGDEEADRWEQAGATGKALLWRLDRARLHRTLDAFADSDQALRARDGTAPAHTERGFGYDGDPVTLALGDGRTVAFRGRVDRVDVGAAGDVVVIDYKTGAAASRYRAALAAHPVAGGQLLQLPVYALAAGEAARPSAGGVRAAYWFLGEDGVDEIAWELDDDGAAAFGEAVATIADGMEQGLYPQRVGHEWARDRETCASCAYELVCDRDRERRWPIVRALPLLSGLARLDGGAAAGPGTATGGGRD
ncbi:MAG TPA: PD-(D/E)XK nuclease family protein, partial [Egibacteraceae bacterium]|nr:PD-(D/E)XK nuclease family protein [Egibacteraceae bacterium]